MRVMWSMGLIAGLLLILGGTIDAQLDEGAANAPSLTSSEGGVGLPPDHLTSSEGGVGLPPNR